MQAVPFSLDSKLTRRASGATDSIVTIGVLSPSMIDFALLVAPSNGLVVGSSSIQMPHDDVFGNIPEVVDN